jgi:hypothetical protein
MNGNTRERFAHHPRSHDLFGQETLPVLLPQAWFRMIRLRKDLALLLSSMVIVPQNLSFPSSPRLSTIWNMSLTVNAVPMRLPVFS